MMPLFRTEFQYIEIGLLCNQQYLELSLSITEIKSIQCANLSFHFCHNSQIAISSLDWMALVCFASCRLKFIIIGKQLALKIDNNPYIHQGFYIRYLVSFTC